ncbi:phospholipase D family protein [Bacillus marinisedimentorum]|uniref:phospholipase D family protein n=1 Tax=Bacillus marinisedimentorum TaxID=1821260 RepID=UPI000871C671|nr:phospholipase D family protein [Bacillus marinisedimentorum]
MENRKKWYRKKRTIAFIIVFLVISSVTLYHRQKPLPAGMSYASPLYEIQEDDLQFLYDLTYERDGKEVYDQSIFNEVNRTIAEAEEFLILDFFLFNDYSNGDRDYPSISGDLRHAIEKQMKKHPSLNVIFISDEINSSYNSHQAGHLAALEERGAEIIYTDLSELRDPNHLYSAIWRTGFSWLGEKGNGWLPNPFGSTAPNITLRSYLTLLNVKANHRKVVITEDAGLILSANPHDASGFHSNVGYKVTGPILNDMIASEKAIAAFSGGDLQRFPETDLSFSSTNGKRQKEETARIRYVTEQKVSDLALQELDNAGKDAVIWLGMFYLADRDIIHALHGAAARGADIRLVLDPNQNAFGQQKIGLPNLPVAAELQTAGYENISIRWYDTNKEQYHAKMLYIEDGKERFVIGGSSNFTSRNLDNYNAEADIAVYGMDSFQFFKDVEGYFDRIWNNTDGTYTVEYGTYQDKLTPVKYIFYLLQKVTQFTTY